MAKKKKPPAQPPAASKRPSPPQQTRAVEGASHESSVAPENRNTSAGLAAEQSSASTADVRTAEEFGLSASASAVDAVEREFAAYQGLSLERLDELLSEIAGSVVPDLGQFASLADSSAARTAVAAPEPSLPPLPSEKPTPLVLLPSATNPFVELEDSADLLLSPTGRTSSAPPIPLVAKREDPRNMPTGEQTVRRNVTPNADAARPEQAPDSSPFSLSESTSTRLSMEELFTEDEFDEEMSESNRPLIDEATLRAHVSDELVRKLTEEPAASGDLSETLESDPGHVRHSSETEALLLDERETAAEPEFEDIPSTEFELIFDEEGTGRRSAPQMLDDDDAATFVGSIAAVEAAAVLKATAPPSVAPPPPPSVPPPPPPRPPSSPALAAQASELDRPAPLTPASAVAQEGQETPQEAKPDPKEGFFKRLFKK